MHLFYPPPKEKPSKSVYLNHSGLVGVCSHPSWEPEKTQSNALGVQDHLSLMTGHSLLITYSSVPARLIITALNKDVMKTPLYFSVPLRVQLSALDQRLVGDRFMSDSKIKPVLVPRVIHSRPRETELAIKAITK